jgi:hypothetical protein
MEDGQTGALYFLIISPFFFPLSFVSLHDSIQVLIPLSHPTIQLPRTNLSLIPTNSKVRKLLSDFSLIGHDLLARGTSKTADTLRPDQDALAHTGPHDQFVTEGGRIVL